MNSKILRILNNIAFAILLASLTSCSMESIRYSRLPVPEKYGARQYKDLNKQQKREFLKYEKGYSDSTINNILNGTVRIGMTEEQVIYSWGRPDDINRSVGSWGVDEQWIYRRGDIKSQYLYFENGKLTSWQD